MQEYTDETLLELLRSPEKTERNKGLTFLYRTFYGNIARFILNNSGTEEDAKDIFQEGLMVLYEKVVQPGFVQTSTLKTFHHAICRNLWLKRLRKPTRKEISIDDPHLLPISDDYEDRARASEVEETQRVLVQQLLSQIGQGCRQLLLLFYFERKSMQEIAEILGLSNDRVAKNKKARGMNKLRELHVQENQIKGKTNQ